MEDFRQPRTHVTRQHRRPLLSASAKRKLARAALHNSDFPSQQQKATSSGVSIDIKLGVPQFLKTLWLRLRHLSVQTYKNAQNYYRQYFNTVRRRVMLMVILFVMLLGILAPVFQNLFDNKVYALSSGENSVLLHTSKSMAEKLKLDSKNQDYMFNQDYSPANAATDVRGGDATIQAKISQDPAQGITVTDPSNKVDFTVVPEFDVGSGKQQENRVVYPAFNGGGHLVYTAGGYGIKQDVTLDHYIGNKLTYDYKLQLGDTYAARLEANGAIGIYGSSLPLNGDISTGNSKDAALLKKARQKAVKDKLLFILPAPKLVETGGHLSDAFARYQLKGDKLTVVVQNLKNAAYPLSVDPTITAASGSGGNGLFSFDANIETNVYVDPSNGFFERSPLTGGNLLTWNTQTGTPAVSNGVPAVAHFLGSAVVYANTLYVIGGTATASSTTNITSSSTYIEEATIASDGSLGVFKQGNSTGLPAGGISRFKALTYNGYMYIIDGSTTNTTGASLSNAVYYTRITSESYSSGNGAVLTNWTAATNKPTNALFDYGAAVYNGYVYVSGGLANIATVITPQSAVLYAPLLPNGDVGTFSSGTAMSTNRFGHDMQAYNGHLYILGGNVNTIASPTLTASTLYASIADTGAIADSSWKSGSNLVPSSGTGNQVIENFGASFSMVYNGYLYVTGGCIAANTTDSCSASGNVASYTQLAQMNADGSLGTFFPNDFQNGGTATLAKVGTPTVGFNGNLYSIAGCSVMATATVSCSTNVSSSSYAAVNGTTTATATSGIGDISANRNPGDLPIGLYGQGTVVLNGFLYVVGGCLNLSCSGTRVTSYDTYWASISANGTLGSWDGTATGFTHADATHYQMALHRDNANGSGGGETGNNNCQTNGLQAADHCGLAAFGIATYNGYIYTVGGVDGANNNHTVYYTKPDPSTGALTGNPAWTTSTNQVGATDLNELGAIARNGALYVIGGCNGGGAGVGCTAGTYQVGVYKSTIGVAGAPGAFGTGSQLQLPTNGKAAFGLAVSGNYIYLAGGIDNGTGGCANTTCGAQTNTILRAKFD